MPAFFPTSARFVVLSFLIGFVQSTCYYPDGSSDSGHFACSSGGTSVCCAEGFQCLSNGFCNDQRYDNYERVLRGGCTDKSWGSGCPSRCTQVWPQGDEAVHKCSSGKFCCGRTDDCCSDSSIEKFDFGSPSVIAIAGESTAEATSAKEENNTPATSAAQQQPQQSQAPEPASSKQDQQQQAPASSDKAQPSSAAAPTSKPAASNNAAASSKKDASSGSPSETDSPNASASKASDGSLLPATVTLVSDRTHEASGAEAAPTSNITNNYISSSNNNNNTVAIAVGVGVGVGVLLFLVVFGACWYMRRKKRHRKPSMRSRDIATEYFEIDGPAPAVLADSKKRNPYGRGSGVLVELDGHRGIELPETGDPKEVDGRSVRKEEKDVEIELKRWP